MMHNAIHVTSIFSTSITQYLNYPSSLFITWFDLLVQFSAHYWLKDWYLLELEYSTLLKLLRLSVQTKIEKLIVKQELICI